MAVVDALSLAGRIILVTGASRGIGGGIALALADAGADLALIGREMATLRDQAARVEALGRRALPIELDVSRTRELAPMVDRVVAHFGRLDALVNMAGFAIRKPILETTEGDYDRLMAVNLKAVYFASQAAARAIIAARGADPSLPRGKILNVASLTSVIALPNIATYVTSRSGVAGMTRAMALEWREHISVNGIAPGYVRTQQTEALFHDPVWVDRTLAKIPLGRFATVEDLAGFAVLLLSSASDYMTGQILYVDGGWLAAG
jgi:NAD(P)-dependent dehydrogenase (short-subunit alcohol dehydrogenase family)